uniref:Uncharacterized protein n=1 Tax=Fagus sylvatica TaxID=28930 RepID=A0A2N9F9X0_FAGSY
MRERENQKQYDYSGGAEVGAERERKHHVDEDLVVGAEVADHVSPGAESPSSPGARRSHRLTESSSS